jgi:hypothetical protein
MFIHSGWESLGCIGSGWGIVYGWIKNGRKQLNIVQLKRRAGQGVPSSKLLCPFAAIVLMHFIIHFSWG